MFPSFLLDITHFLQFQCRDQTRSDSPIFRLTQNEQKIWTFLLNSRNICFQLNKSVYNFTPKCKKTLYCRKEKFAVVKPTLLSTIEQECYTAMFETYF